LLNVNGVSFFKFNLQLQFRHNKNFSLHNYKFTYKFTLKITFTDNQNSGRTKIVIRRGPPIVTSLLLKPLKQRLMASLRSGLRNRFVLWPFCTNALMILVLPFLILRNVQFTKTKFPTQLFFLFYIFYFVVPLQLFLRRSAPSFYPCL
jgi:hypothetical protein